MATATRQHTQADIAADQAERALRAVRDPVIDRLEAQATQVADAVGRRHEWLAAYPAETAWEADLRQRIVARTHELGHTALRDAPDHLTRLLGPPPGTDQPEQRDQWARLAGRIEAHRGRWNLEPADLGTSTWSHGEQARQWERIQSAIDESGVDRSTDLSATSPWARSASSFDLGL